MADRRQVLIALLRDENDEVRQSAALALERLEGLGNLPALVATNLTLIVAFGYWIFKAGYTQPELLYYFLLFLTFLACCHLLRERRPGPSAASMNCG